jgi:UDP-galactopyranose mutase
MNIVCLSHLRWNFVFQRPQHLLRRAALFGQVLYIEEPVQISGASRMDIQRDETGVFVGVPRISDAAVTADLDRILRELLAGAIQQYIGQAYVLWLYTPMVMPVIQDLRPLAVVYDCMDELSGFAGASSLLPEREGELFRISDIVFMGGHSLFEAKRARHPNVHLFPSSVDVDHFSKARRPVPDPAVQAGLKRPRLGFFGVLDERMDYELISHIAGSRPHWQLIFIGPTAKIRPSDLPRARNIHYLGQKSYLELPSYIAGWDVALLPFANNAATRFISPTKTPEYLAAGKPVVSTSIRDVVRPYGERGLVSIADGGQNFVAAIEAALRDDGRERRLRNADTFLAQLSWDRTWRGMEQLIIDVMNARAGPSALEGAARALTASSFRSPGRETSFALRDGEARW